MMKEMATDAMPTPEVRQKKKKKVRCSLLLYFFPPVYGRGVQTFGDMSQSRHTNLCFCFSYLLKLSLCPPAPP